MRCIQDEFLSHPLTPLFTAFGMTGGAEAAGLAGKHKKPFSPAIRTSDPHKPTLWIAAVQVLVYHFLNNRPQVTIVFFKSVLIFQKEWFIIMEEDAVKNCAFRMTLAIDPAHGRKDDSRNGPDCGKRPCSPGVPELYAPENLLKSVNKR